MNEKFSSGTKTRTNKQKPTMSFPTRKSFHCVGSSLNIHLFDSDGEFLSRETLINGNQSEENWKNKNFIASETD